QPAVPPPPLVEASLLSGPNGAVQAITPSRTLRVAVPPPPPRASVFGAAIAPEQPGLSPSGVVKLVVFLIATTAAALVILWMRHNQQAEHERQAKKKEIGPWRLREGLNEPSRTPATAKASLAPDASPVKTTAVTTTTIPDEGTSAGCPLGAKRNHTEDHNFCIDAYEHPGGDIDPPP